MTADSVKRGTPPYISPRTFNHLIEQLQRNLPDRIDRSYLDELHSGSTSTQIMSALRYLNLADSFNKPTHHLKLLIASSGEERVKRLRDIANNAYGFLLNNGSIDIQSATYAQLEELFHDYSGVDGDVRRKCIKFFTSLSDDAGIPLSPHVTKKVRITRGTKPIKTNIRKASSGNTKTEKSPQRMATIPRYPELLDRLMSKFPDYDVEWSDEKKLKWMESFTFFLQKIYPNEQMQ